MPGYYTNLNPNNGQGYDDNLFSYNHTSGYKWIGHVVDVSGACINWYNHSDGTRYRSSGYGISYGQGHPDNVSAPLQGPRQTHNRAELEAVIQAMYLARALGEKVVHIRTTSDYVARGVNDYLNQWEKQGFRRYNGEWLMNVDLWRAIAEARRGMNVQVRRYSRYNDALQLARNAAYDNNYPECN